MSARGSVGRSAVIACMLLAACRGEYLLPPPPAGSTPAPLANAGTGGTFPVTTTITLDASASIATDGELESFEWVLLQGPDGSTSAPADGGAATTTATLDVVGTYTFEVRVTDSNGAHATSDVTEIATGPAITVDAGSDQTIDWAATAHLAGTSSAVGYPTTSSWRFVSVPPHSTAVLTGADTATPSFVADAAGDYVVELDARTQFNDRTAQVTITAVAHPHITAYAIDYADYSKPLDRLIAVSSAPGTLHVVDPATGAETSVALGEEPTGFSLEPSGLRAAVTFFDSVDVIDLQTLAITHVAVNAQALEDVCGAAFAADGKVHMFDGGLGDAPFYTLTIATQTVIQQHLAFVDDCPHARIQPGVPAMYTTSPLGLVRFGTSGNIQQGRGPGGGLPRTESGDLWFVRGGSNLVFANGDVATAATVAAQDMQFVTTLLPPSAVIAPDKLAFEAVADATPSRPIATIAPFGDGIEVLGFYDDATLLATSTLVVPSTSGSGAARVVAYRADGTTLVAVTSSSDAAAIYTLQP